LLDKSVSAQLSREAPSPQDQFQQDTDKLNAVLRMPTPSLLQQVPVGVSVTIHFDSILGGGGDGAGVVAQRDGQALTNLVNQRT
jgi:hypothetical protein